MMKMVIIFGYMNDVQEEFTCDFKISTIEEDMHVITS